MSILSRSRTNQDHYDDRLDTDASYDTDVSDKSSQEKEEEVDEYDDDPYDPETIIEATDKAVFRVEINGLLATNTLNYEEYGKTRSKIEATKFIYLRKKSKNHEKNSRHYKILFIRLLV